MVILDSDWFSYVNYLQGEGFDQDIYIRPPADVERVH